MVLDNDFDSEFDELAALAYRTAFRILGSRADAEEIAQEVMARALVRWRRVSTHARPWVCRSAANEAIGVLRKRERRDRIDAARRHEVTSAAEPVIERIDLQRALLTLPSRQREVLALRYLADLTEADVAAELGISVGTVKTHAHRALTALRVEMTPDQEAMSDVRTS